MTRACILCRGREGDDELRRIEVWSDRLWRLTLSLDAEVLGFAYLEPRRHIPSIADLDGEEALTFGSVLANACSALKEEAHAERVYIYVFGDHVPHLHLHLAPHRQNDALNSNMIKGDIVEEKMESGLIRFISPEFPALPEEEQRKLAEALRTRHGRGA
jgi:diadenosine tetraphosphate (Ap4A) HIT family hydrolase